MTGFVDIYLDVEFVVFVSFCVQRFDNVLSVDGDGSPVNLLIETERIHLAPQSQSFIYLR